MEKILIYDRVKNDHIPRWLTGLVTYLEKKGYQIHIGYNPYIKPLEDYSYIFIWNGSLPIHQPLIQTATRLGIKVIFVEVGFFPQSKYYILDSSGINANSSLMTDDLSWITSNHLNKLDIFAEQYLGNKIWQPPGEYVLCPLQLESDTNIVKHSPFKRMQDFINHVENLFPDNQILFKTHPVLSHINYRISPDNKVIRDNSFIELAVHAKIVYGINSTCLLESMMMNVPTKVIGNGFLRVHRANHRKLLAALIDKQIPVAEMNLDYWVLPFLDGEKRNNAID